MRDYSIPTLIKCAVIVLAAGWLIFGFVRRGMLDRAQFEQEKINHSTNARP